MASNILLKDTTQHNDPSLSWTQTYSEYIFRWTKIYNEHIFRWSFLLIPTRSKEDMYSVKKCKFKFNVKHRECLHNHLSQRLMIKCLTIIQIELEFAGNVGFRAEGKTRVPGEKPFGARKRTNNKLNPHNYDAGSGNQTRETLVGGERSHHRAIPAPL